MEVDVVKAVSHPLLFFPIHLVPGWLLSSRARDGVLEQRGDATRACTGVSKCQSRVRWSHGRVLLHPSLFVSPHAAELSTHLARCTCLLS